VTLVGVPLSGRGDDGSFLCPLQLGKIEGIGSVQLAGENQAHEQVADAGSVQRFVEERVLAVQNRFLQGTLDDVVVERRAAGGKASALSDMASSRVFRFLSSDAFSDE
jgi:hypothetical protein